VEISFQELVRKGKKLVVIRGLKMRIPIFRRIGLLRNALGMSLWRIIPTTLMKIDYQAKSIRITLKPGEYPSIPWRSTWFEHRVRGWAVGKAIIFDDRVVISSKLWGDLC
jgi:hypothetical protein